MANVTSIQTIADWERNVVVKVVGVLDTSNVSKATLIDVSALVPAASVIKLKRLQFSVQEGLSVNLYWDADTDVLLAALSNTGCLDFIQHIGPNNAGAGVTGDVLYETTGWASGTLTFTVVLWFTKD